jgi:hypothetical protein
MSHPQGRQESLMSRSVRFIVLFIWTVFTISLSASSVSLSAVIPTGIDCKTFNLEKKIMDMDSHGDSIQSDVDSDTNVLSSFPAVKKKESSSFRHTTIKNSLACWGVIQVLSILANAIKRVIPLAIQPILQKDLLPSQAVICLLWCGYMTYIEGYKTFQLKFSPLVVKRAFGLSKNPSILNCLFAGPYSMGLFGATKKRMIVSWSVTLGVFAIVKLVKKLPYPWRSIVDAGVVVGLTYGASAMCFQTAR